MGRHFFQGFLVRARIYRNFGKNVDVSAIRHRGFPVNPRVPTPPVWQVLTAEQVYATCHACWVAGASRCEHLEERRAQPRFDAECRFDYREYHPWTTRRRCPHQVKSAPAWRVFAVIRSDGVSAYRWHCALCGRPQPLGPGGVWVPHRDVPRPDQTLVIADLRSWEQCARCGTDSGVQAHHWAPRALFEDADSWPISLLCPECHAKWHRVVRRGAAPRPTLDEEYAARLEREAG